MNYLLLYFVIGAMVAVWTALNQIGQEDVVPDNKRGKVRFALGVAYAMIALAWPLSLIVSVYAIISQLVVREN